jgi:hypothetical protein
MNKLEELLNYKPVTLTQAKLLKLLGFHRPCEFYWQDTDGLPFVDKGLKIADKPIDHNSIKYSDVQVFSAPSINNEDVIKLLSNHLRATTGIGIMFCLKALQVNDFDVEKALMYVKDMNKRMDKI